MKFAPYNAMFAVYQRPLLCEVVRDGLSDQNPRGPTNLQPVPEHPGLFHQHTDPVKIPVRNLREYIRKNYVLDLESFGRNKAKVTVIRCNRW